MSDSIRCFLAIGLPDELKNNLEQYLQRLSKHQNLFRWTKINNLHLTIKFLGEQPAENVNQILLRAMPQYAKYPHFKLTTTHFGGFPKRKRARVIWLGCESNPQSSLLNLYNKTEKIVEHLDNIQSQKKFKPHLTIARSKEPLNPEPLWNFTERTPFPSFQFEVEQILLMQSILKSSGPEYHILQKFSLQ